MKAAPTLFGPVRRNATACAEALGASLTAHGVSNRVLNMRTLSTEALVDPDLPSVVTSTTRDGDPPHHAAQLFRHLVEDRPELDRLRFAVFAVGNPQFSIVAHCRKNVDAIPGKRGAVRAIRRPRPN